MDGGADAVLLERDQHWTDGVAWYSRALTMRSWAAVLGLRTSDHHGVADKLCGPVRGRASDSCRQVPMWSLATWILRSLP